jgi:hypothetical protein
VLPARRHVLAFALGLGGALALWPATVAPAAAQQGAEPGTRAVTVRYQPEDEIGVPALLDRLDPRTVLVVTASDFPPDAAGTVAQCGERQGSRCSNRLPVRTDERGGATFQYLVTDAVDPDGRCRAAALPCTVELTVGDRTAVIDTVFVDAAPPPGELSVTPRTGLRAGDTVSVAATGFPAGAELTVELCADPARQGTRCGSPGPEALLRTGPDGAAVTNLVLEPLTVGTAGVECGRQVDCTMVVRGERSAVRARPVPIGFAPAPTAGYDPVRLALGLATAVVLLGVAAWLVRSTDWSPPAEADASAIDDAEYADLDAEAEAFGPEVEAGAGGGAGPTS